MTSKRRLLLPAVLIVIILGIALVSTFGQISGAFSLSENSNPANAQEETIKVGAILMLSGEFAVIGAEMQKGISIAVDEINSSGGVNGKKVEVIFEDSGFVNSGKLTTAAQKLLEVDNADVILMDIVDNVKPVAPIFEQSKVPVLVVWDNTKFIEGSSEYINSIGFSTEKTGEKMAEFAYTNLHLKKIAVVEHQMEWAEIIGTSFKSKFEKMGGKVVFVETVPAAEKDFRTIISKVKESSADGVYAPLAPTADVFLRQAQEQNIGVQILSGDGITNDVLNAAGDAAEGMYFTNLYSEDNNLLQMLEQSYKKKYSQNPPAIVFTSLAYDGILILKDALSRTGAATPEEIKNALYTVKDLPVSGGELITLDRNKSFERVEKIFVIKNGESIPAE